MTYFNIYDPYFNVDCGTYEANDMHDALEQLKKMPEANRIRMRIIDDNGRMPGLLISRVSKNRKPVNLACKMKPHIYKSGGLWWVRFDGKMPGFHTFQRACLCACVLFTSNDLLSRIREK